MNKNIAIIFDFDNTLAPDTTTAFLELLGINTEKFWFEKVEPLMQQGWDQVLAYMYEMLRWSQHQPWGSGISRDKIISFGNNVCFYPGVKDFFTLINNYIGKKNISLEYYIISSGLGDLLKNTAINKFVKEIFASDFHYNEEGAIVFPRNAVSFTDKTRFIFQISKGLTGPEYSGRSFEVNNKLSYDKIRIPLKNMLYIGDGFTDIPCFSLLQKYGGYSLAVYNRNNATEIKKVRNFFQDNRIDAYYHSDYTEGSELAKGIKKALDNIISSV